MTVSVLTRLPRWVIFGIGGVLNTAVTFLVFLTLLLWMPYQGAYIVAYAVGIVFGYFFATALVFRQPATMRGLAAYPLVYLAQYAVSALMLTTLIEGIGVPVWTAPLIVAIVAFPITFLLSRALIGRTSRAKPSSMRHI